MEPEELEKAGVMPFRITVDRTGHDYLRQMCQPSHYLVIDDIAAVTSDLRADRALVGLRFKDPLYWPQYRRYDVAAVVVADASESRTAVRLESSPS